MAEQAPHTYGSFDYKVINPKIKAILKARSELDNTIQMAMPFVKATTTINLPEYLGADNIGFTLGLHAIREDVKYEDMYAEGSAGLYPLIGYTYTPDGKNKRIYANPPSSQAAAAIQFFDQGATLKSSTNFARVPPPGIIQAKIGRNRNGLLASGQIDFVVPSLMQLEILHRVFLIPGCGMILEWGQQFASEVTPSPGEFNSLKPIQDYMFPWHDRAKLTATLNGLAKREIGIQDILDNHVYETGGQYMWMFGRIANFNTKANSDGSFNCNIKIVGPSEDAWAYSTRTTVIPAIDKTNTVCQANSIEQFFATTAAGENLKTLLDSVLNDTVLPNSGWKSHVVKFDKGNKKEGVEKEDVAEKKEQPNVDESSFADSEDAYFFTWRFFTNVIVNHPKHGILKIFADQLGTDQLSKISLIRPYADGAAQIPLIDRPGDKYIDDPIEPYVGRNKYLRSVDPSTMIIVHEEAAVLAAAEIAQGNRPGDTETLTTPSQQSADMLKVGDFKESISKANTADTDRGFLSSGVWLNHKAVVKAFVGSETFLQGMTNLLQFMNQATSNFWNLTLDNLEAAPKNKYNYIVIDYNWRGSSEEAVKTAIGVGSGEPGLYVFNKYARTDPETKKIVGSELIDSNVELKLPQLLFSQIATLGLVQKEDLSAAGTTTDDGTKSPLISDPNEALRKMFAITTLSLSSKEQGPDLTILPYNKNKLQICGKTNVQTTANTAGRGQRPSGQTSDALKNKDSKQLEDDKKAAQKFLDDNAAECAKCNASASHAGGQSGVLPPETVAYISNTPWSAGFISYVMQSAGVSFPAAGAHTQYAQSIRNGGSGWQALDPKTTKLQPGDVIVQNRAGNNLTYQSGNWSGASHGDVVTSVGGGKVTAVGGNVGDTVKAATFGINSQESLTSSNFFVVLRPPPAVASKIVNTANSELQKWSSNGWKEITPAAFDSLNSYYKAGKLTSSLKGPAAPAPPPNQPPPTVDQNICTKCAQSNELIRQIDDQLATINVKDKLMREFPYLQKVFRYIEPMPEIMVPKIRGDAGGIEANAFGAAPGSLSITADLVMPGINGIRVGELFWIDRIPTFYRAFGAFQVMSIEDTISLDGWKTSVHSVFNYLGNAWKDKVAELLRTAGAEGQFGA